MTGPDLWVPVTFFFSPACAEELRETTTIAAMTPTTPLLSCVMGLSSNLLAWSLTSDSVFFGYHAKSQLSASGLPGRPYQRAFCLEANLKGKRDLSEFVEKSISDFLVQCDLARRVSTLLGDVGTIVPRWS
jgi:hypothetical protein